MSKRVFFFGEGRTDVDSPDKAALGGKGANLCKMAALGVPVPPGLVIPTSVCNEYTEIRKLPDGLMDEVRTKLEEVNQQTGRIFGGSEKPLLVSVRSGAPISMPGMMDTILNLGLNEETKKGMALETGNDRFVEDSHRRFIQMFGNVVMGIKHELFEEILEEHKEKAGAAVDTELDASALRELIEEYRKLVKKETGQEFPDDPWEQLEKAIEAVFHSWNNERAIYYRRMHAIPDALGTAVNVQSMVFGNMGDDSGTGVAFTRNPSTGEKKFYGEYLMNAQGEDVVAGIRTPQPIAQLEKDQPPAYKQLIDIQQKLEGHFQDMQDIEFTIQQGKLYILQTRNGKRTGFAALKIACDMVDEGVLKPEKAITRMDPESVPSLLAQVFDPAEKSHAVSQGRIVGKGLNAGPGAASGFVVFSSEKAHQYRSSGKKSILVRTETSPEDISGMEAAEGILTSRGGMTSHAAVVARGMNKPCIVGCSSLRVDEKKGIMTIVTEDNKSIELSEGDELSIDGGTGEVILGLMKTRESEIQQALAGEIDGEKSEIARNFKRMMEWADQSRKLSIRTNADTPKDAKVARMFGAQGIGLCRTEHMFFEGDRILAMQEMILASSVEQRKRALEKILPYQKEDFRGIFDAMDGFPVTIRLLDPPLHEFLPREEADFKKLASALNIDVELIKRRAEELHEQNPMLGHRGCRLGITYPEITEMQVRAILEAACESSASGTDVHPEIMVPLVGKVNELVMQKKIIQETAEKVFQEKGSRVEFMIGTMIEVPRAAATADEIAAEAEFFSFGTNDLTQMTLGFSRDDAESYIREYLRLNIYERNPFQSIDQDGVGAMVRMAVDKGRSTRSGIKLGVCGEHGGDPTSIKFFHGLGLNYVSCSPFRVAVARLASGIAALESKA
ncbi:MAG: pyruvate, phosphate dikinase [Spirochaetaceae bacterium]|nr:pyruvate, phosphate dikinase [Spirochaetaceae bacterium]|tara:strand:+ start:122682 stop:125384 length:2703 start_codon:yes stop_codon:yes gene_type:complete